MGEGLPQRPLEDLPHDLSQLPDGVDLNAAEQSVRRHISRQAADLAYPYEREGTAEQNAALKKLREQTVEFGPMAIRAAEAIVGVEDRKRSASYVAADLHPHDLTAGPAENRAIDERRQATAGSGAEVIKEAERTVRTKYEDLDPSRIEGGTEQK